MSSKEQAPSKEIEWEVRPEFIYGGPFIKPQKVEPFMDTAAPRNLQLSGTFKKSFAYYSLKERMPVILTKIIDYLSRDGTSIKSKYSASDDDIRSYIQYITKLKNDVVTNKQYDLLTVDTPDAKRWNLWIEAQDQKRYFNNIWLFTECYIYRRLREGCELTATLKSFDPFDAQKEQAFQSSLETMCIVAEKLVTMVPESDKDRKKADFVTLLKLCLWANKCDLSLSAGDQVSLSGQNAENNAEGKNADGKKADGKNAEEIKNGKPNMNPFDPFQMILDLKDKVIIDDTNKIVDSVISKAEVIRKAMENNTIFKAKCSCHRLATLAGMPLCKETSESNDKPLANGTSPAPEEGEAPEAPEPAKVPCPAKMTVPQAVMFDIICDNAAYELFADLCLAHFLIAQNIVQKIRFHVKAIPWFVSDATERDFKYLVDSCANATYTRTIPSEPTTDSTDGESSDAAPRVISSDQLRSVGAQWQRYLEDGTFVVMAEDFWTSPHIYKDMKQRDYNLYRKLQLACALLFKGDLNYRKLLGEKRWNPYLSFEASLQGFTPAPLIAIRTVKSELISGVPKGRYEAITKLDEKWMEKGDYGLIQFCAKGEALKTSERPCVDYGDECFGETCPVHNDM